MRTREVTGVVLAGGGSRRMGTDKALLMLGERRLVDHVADVLGRVFPRVMVVAKEPALYQAASRADSSSARADGPVWNQGTVRPRVIRDALPGRGALVGIYTALAACDTSYAFVVGCDMPFVKPDLLRWMANNCEGWDAFVPSVRSLIEPLFAIYSKACIGPIERSLARGDFRVRGFFGEVRVGYAPEDRLREVDPDLSSFINLNDSRDYAAAMARG